MKNITNSRLILASYSCLFNIILWSSCGSFEGSEYSEGKKEVAPPSQHSASPSISESPSIVENQPISLSDDAIRLAKVEEMYASYKLNDFSNAPDVTAVKAAQLAHSGRAVIIDIRETNERNVSMIEGAITLEEYKVNFGQYREITGILYCTIGYRSGLKTLELISQGYNNVVNLSGSVLSWAHAGYSFVDQNGPTKKVHVYGPTWDLLPSGYVAIY